MAWPVEFLTLAGMWHYVLRGIKHAEGIAGVAKQEQQPITPDLLRKIKSV